MIEYVRHMRATAGARGSRRWRTSGTRPVCPAGKSRCNIRGKILLRSLPIRKIPEIRGPGIQLRNTAPPPVAITSGHVYRSDNLTRPYRPERLAMNSAMSRTAG